MSHKAMSRPESADCSVESQLGDTLISVYNRPSVQVRLCRTENDKRVARYPEFCRHPSPEMFRAKLTVRLRPSRCALKQPYQLRISHTK